MTRCLDRGSSTRQNDPLSATLTELTAASWVVTQRFIRLADKEPPDRIPLLLSEKSSIIPALALVDFAEEVGKGPMLLKSISIRGSILQPISYWYFVNIRLRKWQAGERGRPG